MKSETANEKKELLSRVTSLIQNHKIYTDSEVADQAQCFFQEYLKHNPFDTEIWIKFALILYLSALNDDVGATECLEKILEYDPDNILVLLFLVYIHQHQDVVGKELFEKLLNLHTDDNKIMSMVEYAKSWYYLVRDEFELYEESLLKSTHLCDEYLWNYVDLGQFYIKKGYHIKGYDLMKKGLYNFEYVYDENHPFDILDIEDFFKERFKGVRLSDSNYKIILESFDPESPWMTGDFINKREPGSEN